MYIYTNARLTNISLKEKKRKANVNATKGGHEFFVPLGGEEDLSNVAKVEGVCAHIQ
jgi:hypothetical protein